MYRLRVGLSEEDVDCTVVPDLQRLRRRHRHHRAWGQIPKYGKTETLFAFAREQVAEYHEGIKTLAHPTFQPPSVVPVWAPQDRDDVAMVQCMFGLSQTHFKEIPFDWVPPVKYRPKGGWNYFTGLDVAQLQSCIADMDIAEEKLKDLSIDDCRAEKNTKAKAITYSQHLLEMDGYLLSYLMGHLRTSQVFRKSFLEKYAAWDTIPDKNILSLIIQVKEPAHHYFDRIGNRMMLAKLNEKLESENAFSWLSTLGGAFSALGDLSPNWAKQAGRISIAQLQIAMATGDPFVASRCRLYAAISLLQLGHLRSARKIIRNEFDYAKSLPSDADPKLPRMCHGIWAKLAYARTLHAEKKKLKQQSGNPTPKRQYRYKPYSPNPCFTDYDVSQFIGKDFSNGFV